MEQMPDNYFELAIVDPPYGIGDKLLKGGHNGTVRFHEHYEAHQWNDVAPNKNYFTELMRISKNQIIWGGNYFIDYLSSTRGIIAWDKLKGNVYNFSHFEFAWTSFDCIARIYKKTSHAKNRFHPTQKPVALYKWLLNNYAKKGDKILDTHMGSGSSIIACYDLGFDYMAFELDTDYYNAAMKRINKHTSQQSIFDLGVER